MMKFKRNLDELRDLLDHHDVLGSWEAQPNGVFMMRCADGANLHWARGSKSLWIAGKDVSRRRLSLDVAGILHALPISMCR